MDLICHPMVMPISVPVLAGLVCLLLPRTWERLHGVLAVAGSAVTLLLVWPLFTAGAGVLGDGRWLTLDYMSAFVLLGVAVFGFLIALYSLPYMAGKSRLRAYYASLLVTIGISCGVVLANDLLLLLIFWGMLGVTLYVMVGIAGPDASSAAKKSFIVIGGSDCLMMLGTVIVWVLTGTTRIDQVSLGFTSELRYVAFFCFTIAAFAKAGAMPVHSWVPDCGEKAPLSVTAFLPASVDKLLGIYLLVRVVTGMFVMNNAMNGLLMLAGAATIICAVMMALVQHDLKRLLSYHAVSQVGYMVLGIGTGTVIGIAGGLFHMLNHAIYKSCLFLSAGAVEKRTGTTDLDKLGGLATAMPLTFGSCLVASLAISGIPPLNGFFSKWMVYQGLVEKGRGGGSLWVICLVAAMLGSALTLASFVKVLHATFLRKPAPELAERKTREVSAAMWAPMASLAVLCVLFGVLAVRIPLKGMIFPAIGQAVAFTGDWWAGRATVLLVVGYAVGLAICYLSTGRRARECETYIGGEIMSESERADVELSGVDFYRTMEEMPPFRGLFSMARRKLFDIYDVGTKMVFYCVEALRAAHTGILPMYLTWFLAGLLAILWLLVYGTGA